MAVGVVSAGKGKGTVIDVVVYLDDRDVTILVMVD